MTTLTIKTYKRVLTNVIKSDTKQAENIQSLLEFGFDQVFKINEDGSQNNNLSVLSEIVKASGSMRNKLTKVITAYITDNIKHIVWDKDQYKKVKDKKVAIEGGLPLDGDNVRPYWISVEMDKQGEQNKPKYNINKRMDTLIKQLADAKKDDRMVIDKTELQKQVNELLDLVK